MSGSYKSKVRGFTPVSDSEGSEEVPLQATDNETLVMLSNIKPQQIAPRWLGKITSLNGNINPRENKDITGIFVVNKDGTSDRGALVNTDRTTLTDKPNPNSALSVTDGSLYSQTSHFLVSTCSPAPHETKINLDTCQSTPNRTKITTSKQTNTRVCPKGLGTISNETDTSSSKSLTQKVPFNVYNRNHHGIENEKEAALTLLSFQQRENSAKMNYTACTPIFSVSNPLEMMQPVSLNNHPIVHSVETIPKCNRDESALFSDTSFTVVQASKEPSKFNNGNNTSELNELVQHRCNSVPLTYATKLQTHVNDTSHPEPRGDISKLEGHVMVPSSEVAYGNELRPLNQIKRGDYMFVSQKLISFIDSDCSLQPMQMQTTAFIIITRC